MQFNPHIVVVDRASGEPITEDRKKDGKEVKINLTHGLCAVRALETKYRGEEELKPEDGLKRFVLASRILEKLEDGMGLLDISAKEEELIREMTAKLYPPGIYGQIHLAIDAARDAAKALVKAAEAQKPQEKKPD